MNTRNFIGRFPSIAHLAKPDQHALLERARHEAFVNSGLAGWAAFYLISCCVVGVTIALAPPLLLGFNVLLSLFSLANGILFAGYAYQRLYGGLLARGLEKVVGYQSE